MPDRKIPPGSVDDRRGEEASPSRRFYGRMKRGFQVYGRLLDDPPKKGEYDEDIERTAREIHLKAVMEELERRDSDIFKEKKR